MPAKRAFPNVEAFIDELKHRHASRRDQGHEHKLGRRERRMLSPTDRRAVLAKTASRCHICGGEIEGTRWHADHVKAHSTGAEREVVNHLPVHAICNNHRWDYSSDEFQWILKLGVWLRSEVERETRIGRAAGEKFTGYDAGRAARRERAGSKRQPK